jgi:hypothetical protein
MSKDTGISPWLAGALCLLGGTYGFWRYSLSPFKSARYFGFVVGVPLTYLVIYHWRRRSGFMWTLEICLTGSFLGALVFLNSSAFGLYTPVVGAVLGFLVAAAIGRLLRIRHCKDSKLASNRPDEKKTSKDTIGTTGRSSFPDGDHAVR